MRAEILRLKQVLETCDTHAAALQEALTDIRQEQDWSAEKLASLDKQARRLLDQFAFRYTRLQDDMGQKLFPAILAALGEEVASLSMLDRMNRLEQLGCLPSAESWQMLRLIRNEFAHDYPETTIERSARLQMATRAAEEVLGVFARLVAYVEARLKLV